MRQGRRARGYPSSGHHGGFNASRYLGFAGNPGPSRGGTGDNGWVRNLGQLPLICLTPRGYPSTWGSKPPVFFCLNPKSKTQNRSGLAPPKKWGPVSWPHFRPALYDKSMDMTIPVTRMIPCTEAEGPGKRFALWVQGCPLRCPGCCNPEMLPFEGGTNHTLEALCEQLRAAQKEHTLEGLTLLGGEPTAHAKALAPLASFAQSLGLDVLLFSGSTHEELLARKDPDILALLSHTDILVDGPYQKDNPEPHRRFIGSANQRILRLSARTPADDRRWEEPNTLELRLENQAGTLSLMVNGFPAPQAMGLWKRVPLH